MFSIPPQAFAYSLLFSEGDFSLTTAASSVLNPLEIAILLAVLFGFSSFSDRLLSRQREALMRSPFGSD